MKNRIATLIIFFMILFIYSCKTTEPPIVEEPVVTESSSEEQVTVDPVVEEPDVITEPETEIVVNDETGFIVSVEIFNKTFDEMKMLIEKLNEIISSKNYEKWKLYLSNEYIKTYNDKTKLKQISEQSQILADNGIVLESLKDYFEWVVVPSRSKASLDDIVFIDDNHLTGYMLIKDKRTILYQLEKIEDKWLISVW